MEGARHEVPDTLTRSRSRYAGGLARGGGAVTVVAGGGSREGACGELQ